MSKFYIISLDPAQLHDYSALAVLECSSTSNNSNSNSIKKNTNIYRLVSLNRKQRLPYTDIVSWAKKVFENPKFRQHLGITSRPVFILDVGGVGRAIQDMLTAVGVKSVGIQLTGGESITREGDTWRVTKSFVVGKFLGAWDEGRVQRPRLAMWRSSFEKELLAFRGEMSTQGRARFEASEGEHDDQVMAVAQAVWWGEICQPPPTSPVAFYSGSSGGPDLFGQPVQRPGVYEQGQGQHQAESEDVIVRRASKYGWRPGRGPR